MFSKIDAKKLLLDNKRPLPEYTLKSLREKILLEWTYNTNAIEGNTLTLSETKVVLEGITVGGKTLREHLEVINHQQAISYVEDIVRKEEPMSQWQIKNIHRLILKGINDDYAGVYRDHEMEALMNWYEKEATALHPIVRGAMLHAIFVGIHPFIDGNGRTSRLLLNLELMKSGYPPIIIEVKHRLAYYESLDEAIAKKNYTKFIDLVASATEKSLDLYLSVLD